MSKRQGEKVLLVNPNRMRPPVAPLALDYLASALQGFEVDFLDLCFVDGPLLAIGDYLSHNKVLAIAVTLRNTDDTCFASQDFFIPKLKEVADCLKEHTEAPLILGGSGFSIMPEAILSYCGLDLGLWGEGEYSLPLLLARIAAKEDFRDVPGLVYRAEEGFCRNSPHYLDLGGPASSRRLVDNGRYFREGGMAGIETKRGCPKGCIYCADPLGKGWWVRLRPPREVVAEMEALVGEGIDHFHLCDSEFNIPEHHAREVCSEVVARGLGDRVRWYTYASPVPFSEELALLFRKAGCAGIDFGVDSASDGMLRRLGRDFTAADLAATARACHRQGIVFMYDLLLGGPGETRESLRATVETMKGLSPSRVGAAFGVRIFPKTRLAALVRRQGPLRGNPNLCGAVAENEDFFAPIFYLSSELGPEAEDYLKGLIGGDERFFFMGTGDSDRNYNYNENSALMEAIRRGYRGAFWDILRRVAENEGPRGV